MDCAGDLQDQLEALRLVTLNQQEADKLRSSTAAATAGKLDTAAREDAPLEGAPLLQTALQTEQQDAALLDIPALQSWEAERSASNGSTDTPAQGSACAPQQPQRDQAGVAGARAAATLEQAAGSAPTEAGAPLVLQPPGGSDRSQTPGSVALGPKAGHGAPAPLNPHVVIEMSAIAPSGHSR
jgi:hypothetical protein